MNYQEVITRMIEKKITLGSVESLTGGLFASIVSGIPGVSAIYKGSIVSYANEIKERVVGVSRQIIDDGVVSSICAQSMAQNGKNKLDVDLCVSFTGNAGPSVLEGKEVGLVYIGIAYHTSNVVYECHFHGSRNEIRQQCVDFAFEKINLIIN